MSGEASSLFFAISYLPALPPTLEGHSVADSPEPPSTELVRTCDLCGSQEHTLLLSDLRDRFFRLPGSFTLLRCAQCGLVRLSPRPDGASLPLYYPSEGYEPHAPGIAPESSDRTAAHVRDVSRRALLRALGYPAPALPHWARLIPSRRIPTWLVRRAAYDLPSFPAYVEGGRALDIGCGNGAFLDRIRRHGWDVVGVDTSSTAAAAARASFGLTVHVARLEDAPLAERSFDFVHMSHVIEHLPQPVQTLRHVARLMRPGARLYIETPNIDSLSFRCSREHWFPLETPRHLWLFSPTTLRRALSDCGFSVTSMKSYAFPTFDWEATYRREEHSGERSSPRPRIEPRELPRALALTALTRIVRPISPRSGDILVCTATA
jgi:2-polyprenyl-3-methyl-5-hydroxy-6-metoxy-1,4-benzoquinol methylase